MIIKKALQPLIISKCVMKLNRKNSMRYQNNTMRMYEVIFWLNGFKYTNTIRASSLGCANIRIKAALRDLFGDDGNYDIVSVVEVPK